MAIGQVRIIGGQWRGRKLKVPVIAGLRPTPDRVRETLFNWLTPVISGAYCLDLFAGSGALGFEALSRGARHVVMMDHAATAIQLLRETASLLQATNVTLCKGRAPEQLSCSSQQFDIVFLDPPYQHNLLLPCCFYLEEHNLLNRQAWIYLETDKMLSASSLPSTWRLLKSKQAGQVAYHLAVRTIK